VSKKPAPKPVWWKNTFFWIAGALLLLAIFGAIRGEDSIRDPGQVFETGIVWIYLGGSVVMLINGWMTHRQALQHFEEQDGAD